MPHCADHPGYHSPARGRNVKTEFQIRIPLTNSLRVQVNVGRSADIRRNLIAIQNRLRIMIRMGMGCVASACNNLQFYRLRTLRFVILEHLNSKNFELRVRVESHHQSALGIQCHVTPRETIVFIHRRGPAQTQEHIIRSPGCSRGGKRDRMRALSDVLLL